METQKTSKFKDGFTIAKSSWNVFKLDKELIVLQFLGILISFIILASIFGVASILAAKGINVTEWQGWQQVIAGAGAYLIVGTLITFIVNIFTGSIIFGATERFKGSDPTVKSSLRGAISQWRPLALFSLMMTTVGLLLQLVQERIPLAGKIAVWLVGAAWSTANIFAVPVIVLGKKSITPIGATKESVKVIRKVWGEGVAASLGIGLVAVLSVMVYLAIALVIVVLAVSKTSTIIAVVGVSLSILGLLCLIMLLSTLSAIFKAALYYYATTGEAPEMFNKRLLQEAVTPKKARKIFA